MNEGKSVRSQRLALQGASAALRSWPMESTNGRRRRLASASCRANAAQVGILRQAPGVVAALAAGRVRWERRSSGSAMWHASVTERWWRGGMGAPRPLGRRQAIEAGPRHS